MIEGTIECIAENSGGVLSKAYDDMVHPTAEAVGTLISYPFRGIRVLCGKYEKWLINGEESLHIVGEAVHKKMEKVPPEKQCVPDAYVAIPTIQQICLSQDSEALRDMYANLLVSSMNTDTKHKVLPGYVNIIGQLCPDEAKLIKYFYKNNQKAAFEVRVWKNQKEFIVVNDSFVDIPENLLEIDDNLNLYIENLVRLQILKVTKDKFLSGEDNYLLLECCFTKFIKKRQFLRKSKYDLIPEVLEITLFGYQFADLCMDGV